MNAVQKALRDLIRVDGPQSLARLMQFGLIFPTHGYYESKEAIGRRGDFITSPEISQLFGEMMAIKISHWHASLKSVKPIEIIELGPGHGTQLADILRSLEQIESFNGAISGCSLVEISQNLRVKQESALKPFSSSKRWFKSVDEINLDDYIEKSVVIIAHEFFDALPRHAFRRTEAGAWRELLLGLDGSSNFCLTTSPSPTKIQFALEKDLRLSSSKNDEVEMSPESLRVAEWIRSLLRRSRPSLGIITDYGSVSPPGFSLRAIKDHRILPTVTEDIGDCDISGDVDFGSLLGIFQKELKSEIFYQGEFLQRMGIEQRAKELIHRNKDKPRVADSIAREYHRLVDPKQMGSIYKILTVES